MKLVEMRINNSRILKLLRKWLTARVMEEGTLKRLDLGTPQGGVLSPLLANINLNYFDVLWERHGNKLGKLTRYADDFVIVCKTKRDAEHAYRLIRAIMERLELTLHPTKTRIVGLWTGEKEFDFFGMHSRYHLVEHKGYHLGQIVDRIKMTTNTLFNFCQNGRSERTLIARIEEDLCKPA